MARTLSSAVFAIALFTATAAAAVTLQFTDSKTNAVSTTNGDNLSWSAANTVSISLATSSAAQGKATFDTLSFTKSPDAMSSSLLTYLTLGTHYGTLTITAGSVTWKLGMVFVTHLGYTLVGTTVQEQVKLTFGQAKVTVGTASYGWDATKNIAWTP